MESYRELLVVIASFVVIAFAAKEIAQYFARVNLPLISGFLLVGLLAGPYVLNLIHHDAIEQLRFADETALAVIAFAAGSELYIKELRQRFRSIAWVTAGLVVTTFVLGSLAVFLLANSLEFVQELPAAGAVGVAILAGSILVARSPSSAIAIVNELRARGPFTQTALGVTVISDVVVIVLFAVVISVADALLNSVSMNAGFVVLLALELLLSLALGFILGKVLELVLAQRMHGTIKRVLMLILGYGVFVLATQIRALSRTFLPVEVFVEPLLVCMIGSFVLTNYTAYRSEFLTILHDVGPTVYIVFFTLTGASLALDVLAQTWLIALAIFAVRLITIVVGAFGGGVAAGDPLQHNRLSWMTYITQAGIGLGLAQEVVVEFPTWGTAFATMIISVIVINQLIGPPFFKWAITAVGEAHGRAQPPDFDGVRDALIFGLEGQSLALARQLTVHGWRVKVASRKAAQMAEISGADVDIHPIGGLTLDTLNQLDAGQAEAIVFMLSDEENYRLCELAYEHFGTGELIVRLNDRANFDRFHALGALIVHPSTAIVSLLDQFVRSPTAASLLLGIQEGQEVIDIEVRNEGLHGLALRDVRIPLDTLVLSVHRNGDMLISHGYTTLEVGDIITMVGSPSSLEQVSLRFALQ